MTKISKDFIVFVDKAQKVAEIDSNGIYKIQKLFFMNTRKIDLSSTKRKKLREKQDEIELLYTTYGYFSYKGNLSSRFGGSYGGLGYGVGNGIGGNRLGFGGFERKERRIEYVANQGMHHDLDTCGCENFKLDVIFVRRIFLLSLFISN